MLQYYLDSIRYRVDDIIKAITTLQFGRSYSVVDVAENDRDFASGCNLLLNIVYNPKPASYSDQIAKYVQLICDQWWSSEATFIDDKVIELQFSP